MVVMDERAPSFFEKFAVKAKQEPLVPIGAIATVGFLVSGMTCAVSDPLFQEHHSITSSLSRIHHTY